MRAITTCLLCCALATFGCEPLDDEQPVAEEGVDEAEAQERPEQAPGDDAEGEGDEGEGESFDDGEDGELDDGDDGEEFDDGEDGEFDEGEDPDEGEEGAGSPGGDRTSLEPSCAGDRSSTGAVRGPIGAMQAVGDSIIAWNDDERRSIADVVGELLGVPMQNNAVGGAELLGNDEPIPTQYRAGNYSHVLVNGGGNDFSRECARRTLDAIVSPDLQSGAMVDLIERIGRDGGQAVIVSYFIPRDWETGCDLFPELLRRYRALGSERDDAVYVCTLEAVTPASPGLYADAVHPSVAGSAAVGRVIADYLRR